MEMELSWFIVFVCVAASNVKSEGLIYGKTKVSIKFIQK
jgi:hypothetical protein